MGQQPHAGDVADGPQALPGAQVRVDSDALRSGVGADRFQAGGYARRRPVATSRWSPRSSGPPSRDISSSPQLRVRALLTAAYPLYTLAAMLDCVLF